MFPGSRGLLAGGGDLFGEIRGGVDESGVLYVEVGEEHDLDAISHVRIVIDHVRHCVDQLDDQLRHEIPWSGFPSEDEGSGHNVDVRILFDAVVQGQDVQHVEVLSLVFMKTFHLDIEKRVRVHDNAGTITNRFGQIDLVESLDATPLGLELFVLRKSLEFPELLQVRDPAISDPAGDQVCQSGVAQHHEAPRSHAVGLVAEFFRVEFIEVTENILFQQFRVQLGHTVNTRDYPHRPDWPCGHIFLRFRRSKTSEPRDRHLPRTALEPFPEIGD